mmetsp:Transcript_90948/g.266304  ORF Transcript_90948/g.266304 Transcript_90948/m.266304 type:complete len:319 (-) Transcript_90948:131-1087(-)
MERISTPTASEPFFIWSSQLSVKSTPCMMWSAKLCSIGPCTMSPTKRLKVMTSLSPKLVTTLNLRAPLSGPSAMRASYLDFCSRIVSPLTSTPRFGKTMSRSSGSPLASNWGDTSGLPTQSLNFAFALSMRHSTRATSLPSTSLGCTTRLSGSGRLRPGGGGILSVCARTACGCSCSSSTRGSAVGGAVFSRLDRRAAPRPGGASADSSITAGASTAFAAVGLTCLRTSATPTFLCRSLVSLSMSAMSLEICPRDRSSFCTLELIVCTWASKAGAWLHAWAAMSANGRVLAASGEPEKGDIIPPRGVPAAGVPATGEP